MCFRKKKKKRVQEKTRQYNTGEGQLFLTGRTQSWVAAGTILGPMSTALGLRGWVGIPGSIPWSLPVQIQFPSTLPILVFRFLFSFLFFIFFLRFGEGKIYDFFGFVMGFVARMAILSRFFILVFFPFVSVKNASF